MFLKSASSPCPLWFAVSAVVLFCEYRSTANHGGHSDNRPNLKQYFRPQTPNFPNSQLPNFSSSKHLIILIPPCLIFHRKFFTQWEIIHFINIQYPFQIGVA